MFDIWETVLELRQPCLTRPPPTSCMDVGGKVSNRILASIDRILIEHMNSCLFSWNAFDEPLPRTMPDERWLNTSAMQKAIRRGDARTAVASARVGFSIDPEHTFRRLAVCAVEDVGIGNLLAVATALAVAGSSAHKRRVDADRIAAYLANSLAISAKSRLACDLLSIVDYDNSLAPQKRDWSRQSDQELASQCLKKKSDINEQMLSAWLLAGTARFRGVTLPADNVRRRNRLMQCMTQARMPLMLYYIADRAAARTSDAMFVSFLPIWTLLSEDQSLELSWHTLPLPSMIGGYPAYAYDAHTREGRSALRRFGKECREIRGSLDCLSSKDRETAIGNGVFLVEGGRQDCSVTFPLGDEISAAAHFKELEFANVATLFEQSEFLRQLQDSLPVLDDLRRELIRGSDHVHAA